MQFVSSLQCLVSSLAMPLLLLSSFAQAAETVYAPAAPETVLTEVRGWLESKGVEKAQEWTPDVDQAGREADVVRKMLQQAIQKGSPELAAAQQKITQARPAELAQILSETKLTDENAWMNNQLVFWLGAELAERHLYEEALDQLQQVEANTVIDPASYFFHKAVCEHHLLLKEPATASLNSLLTECRDLPIRYRSLGELMQQDLARLDEKTLDGISRKMRDVERRLNIGRSGQKVQKVEKEIIESLDELIAKLEQQNSGGGGGSGQGSGQQPNAPANDSSVKGQTAPGEVDEKEIAQKDGWGQLPPKEQAKAKQILGTMFPPHYQRAIEAYNRKAAQRNPNRP